MHFTHKSCSKREKWVMEFPWFIDDISELGIINFSLIDQGLTILTSSQTQKQALNVAVGRFKPIPGFLELEKG